MENKLAKNIRDYRKNLGFTQEQLAERLGITLGTISKWERGSSEPDLGYIMDLAELFHVSVDALIGFSMHGTDAEAEADRIEELVNKVSFEEVEAEYENALKRFPNNFRIVSGAASIFKRYGTIYNDEIYMKRALELLRHSIELISQNRDPEINEVVIRNEIAGCYHEMKDHKRAVEEYRKNNLNGCNNARIGLVMIKDLKNPEEGIEYIEKAFLGQMGDFVTSMGGYIHYYLRAGKPAMGIRAADMAVEYLEKTKAYPDKNAFPDKVIPLFILTRAIAFEMDGQTERAEEDLKKAVRKAEAFDKDPVYTLENMVFLEHIPKTAYIYDDSGPTAIEGLRTTMEDAKELVSGSFMKKFEKAFL